MKVLFKEQFPWKTFSEGKSKVYYVGDREIHAQITKLWSANKIKEIETLLCSKKHGHFAGIIESPKALFAYVDPIRSTPLFFDSKGRVSNAAELLHSKKDKIDEVSQLECLMAGYASSNNTLYTNIKQLQSGDYLIIDSKKQKVKIYYHYLPDSKTKPKKVDYVKQLATVIDNCIDKVIAKANGKTIWVPLSGGLDSRLILAKLVEKNYKNIRSFSYGPSGNSEAVIARKVAKNLGVKWQFVKAGSKVTKIFFNSQLRKQFWSEASGLCSVPNHQDFFAIYQLRQKGEIKHGDVLVNGQSGDFITGGHIPQKLLSKDVKLEDFYDSIIAKHYSLWQSLKTPANLKKIKDRINSSINVTDTSKLKSSELVNYYEYLEYKERQTKFIVNGQRVYDFLNIDWALPLWDMELIEFFRNIPAKDKAGQKIYKEYLRKWDYNNVFSSIDTYTSQWPGNIKWLVLPILRVIRLTRGYNARDRFQKKAEYFSNFNHFYASYPFSYYLSYVNDVRNPISLFVKTWFEENDIPSLV